MPSGTRHRFLIWQVVDERTELPRGGVFTPGGLVGGGGVRAVQRLVARLGKCGVRIAVAGGAGPAE